MAESIQTVDAKGWLRRNGELVYRIEQTDNGYWRLYVASQLGEISPIITKTYSEAKQYADAINKGWSTRARKYK